MSDVIIINIIIVLIIINLTVKYILLPLRCKLVCSYPFCSFFGRVGGGGKDVSELELMYHKLPPRLIV